MDNSEFAKFIDLVRQMRHNQKRFKRLNKPEIMDTMQNLENEVDEIVNKYTDTQLNLFK